MKKHKARRGKMVKIVQDQNSDKRYRYVLFKNLESKHLVTTVDYGNVKPQLLQPNLNGHFPLLSSFFKTEHLIATKCRHGDLVIPVYRRFKSKTPPNVDGLIYYHPRKDKEIPIVIASTTADCPYLLIEYKGKNYKIVGIVHCGWRSTKANIVQKAIYLLIKQEINPAKIKIALWSGICQRCYEVGNDVKQALAKYQNHFQAGRNNNWQLDLVGVIRQQLYQEGIKNSQIEESYLCSYCYQDENKKPLFYSHRRGNKTARNGLFIQA